MRLMMADLEQQLKKRIDSGDLNLPVLPAVGVRVLELTQDDDSDANDLATLIQNDQSLTSYVMKVANSAAFSSYGKIQTLQQAITKLGLKNISQMALTMTVGQSVFKSDPMTREITTYIWQHSLLCALWSKEIARLCHVNAEVVFLAALLHQIGKPVALHTINEILDEGELPERDSLLMLIEKYQKTIGVNLANCWDLPESVVTTIQHIDEYHFSHRKSLDIAVVNAARLLADISLASGEPVKFVDAIDNQGVFNELVLSEAEIQRLDNKRESVGQMMQALVL